MMITWSYSKTQPVHLDRHVHGRTDRRVSSLTSSADSVPISRKRRRVVPGMVEEPHAPIAAARSAAVISRRSQMAASLMGWCVPRATKTSNALVTPPICSMQRLEHQAHRRSPRAVRNDQQHTLARGSCPPDRLAPPTVTCPRRDPTPLEPPQPITFRSHGHRIPLRSFAPESRRPRGCPCRSQNRWPGRLARNKAAPTSSSAWPNRRMGVCTQNRLRARRGRPVLVEKQLAVLFRREETGRDRIDPHAFGRPLASQELRQVEHGRFRRRIGHHTRESGRCAERWRC